MVEKSCQISQLFQAVKLHDSDDALLNLRVFMRKILSQDQLVFSTIKTYVLNFDTLVDLSQEEVTVQ